MSESEPSPRDPLCRACYRRVVCAKDCALRWAEKPYQDGDVLRAITVGVR